MIYIIFGASGSGKTTLLEIIKSRYSNISIHVKGTTRLKRQYDEEEIESYPEGLPKDKYNYIYNQYGYSYGIEKRQIEESLKLGISHFIICNDIETIEVLKRDYGIGVKVLFLAYDATEETIKEIQRKRCISDDEIDIRIKKINALNQTFIEKKHLFDEIIKNTFGDIPEKSLVRQLNRVFENYKEKSSENMVNQVIEIIKKQEIKEQKQVLQKDLVFIIMQTGGKAQDSYEDLKYSISNAVKRLDLVPYIADDEYSCGSINEKIKNHIRLAEFVIADLTNERQNCYYEFGFADALEKKIIITAREGTHIHLNVFPYEIIYYNKFSELDRKIGKELKYLVEKNKELLEEQY